MELRCQIEFCEFWVVTTAVHQFGKLMHSHWNLWKWNHLFGQINTNGASALFTLLENDCFKYRIGVGPGGNRADSSLMNWA